MEYFVATFGWWQSQLSSSPVISPQVNKLSVCYDWTELSWGFIAKWHLLSVIVTRAGSDRDEKKTVIRISAVKQHNNTVTSRNGQCLHTEHRRGQKGAVCQLFLVFSLLSLVPTAGHQLCVLLMVKMFSPDPALACWVMETSQLYW